MENRKQRPLLSRHHCSPTEVRLLKALRALNWKGTWPNQAGFLLEQLGVNPEHHFAFARLMKSIQEHSADFELLGPGSPFVSQNELELLGALSSFSRKKVPVQGESVPAQPPASMATLFGACAMALRIGGVIMKSRPVPALTALPDLQVTARPLHQHARLRPAKVAEVFNVSPRLKRIVITGVSLFDFPEGRPGHWVKLFLEPGNDGIPVGRAYSVLEWDAERRRMRSRSHYTVAGRCPDGLPMPGSVTAFPCPGREEALSRTTPETGCCSQAMSPQSLPFRQSWPEPRLRKSCMFSLK